MLSSVNETDKPDITRASSKSNMVWFPVLLWVHADVCVGVCERFLYVYESIYLNNSRFRFNRFNRNIEIY